MKKVVAISIALMAMFAIFSISVNSAFAEETILEASIVEVNTLVDKNGAPFARAIVEVEKMLQGVEFTVERPLNAFGNDTEKLSLYSPGEKVRVVAEKRTFNNREYYTVIAFLDQKQP